MFFFKNSDGKGYWFVIYIVIELLLLFVIFNVIGFLILIIGVGKLCIVVVNKELFN